MGVIRVARSAYEVPEQEWNELVSATGSSVFHRQEWLAALEDSGLVDAAARHITIFEEGRLVAAVPLFLTRYCPKFEMFRSYYVQSGLADSNALVAHSMYAQSTEILARTPDARQAALTAVEELWAETGGTDLLALPMVREEDPLLAAVRERSEYRVGLLSCTNLLDIEWPTFTAYLASRTSAKRRNIQRGITESEAAGVKASIGVDVVERREVAAMVAATAEHHGSPLFFTPAFLDAIFDRLARYVECIALHANGRLLLTCVLLNDGVELTPWCIGFDYSTLSEYGHYNYLYGTIVQYAIERGIRRVNFGRSTYYIKHKYGCRLRPVHLAARTKGDVEALDRWVRAVDERAHAELAAAPRKTPRKASGEASRKTSGEASRKASRKG